MGDGIIFKVEEPRFEFQTRGVGALFGQGNKLPSVCNIYKFSMVEGDCTDFGHWKWTAGEAAFSEIFAFTEV